MLVLLQPSFTAFFSGRSPSHTWRPLSREGRHPVLPINTPVKPKDGLIHLKTTHEPENILFSVSFPLQKMG